MERYGKYTISFITMVIVLAFGMGILHHDHSDEIMYQTSFNTLKENVDSSTLQRISPPVLFENIEMSPSCSLINFENKIITPDNLSWILLFSVPTLIWYYLRPRIKKVK
ncbi:hypothetical protein KKA47_02260 [bacterium]|nr:hypothetical protein [bacterium]